MILPNALGFFGNDAEIPGDVSAAVLDLDLHLELAAGERCAITCSGLMISTS